MVQLLPPLRLGPFLAVEVAEGLVNALRTRRREVFLSQSALLEIEAPIKVCCDIFNQYHDLLRLFEYGGFSPENILLGDYVDCGKQSLETMILQSAYKAKYPENFFLL